MEINRFYEAKNLFLQNLAINQPSKRWKENIIVNYKKNKCKKKDSFNCLEKIRNSLIY